MDLRESALVAHRDAQGREVLVVHRPIAFNLSETARAMHAVVDPLLAMPGTRQRVGRSRVREVLRGIVINGWPPQFVPDPERVEFWRNWLIHHHVFTDQQRDVSW